MGDGEQQRMVMRVTDDNIPMYRIPQLPISGPSPTDRKSSRHASALSPIRRLDRRVHLVTVHT